MRAGWAGALLLLTACGSLEVEEVSMGSLLGCAREAGGTVRCWGQPVLDDPSTWDTPEEVPGLEGVTALTVADLSVYATRADGSVAAFGFNFAGQLGDGTTTSRHTPAPVKGLSNVAEVVVSGNIVYGSFACARLTDGTVRCWGSNTHGQLGTAEAPQKCKDLYGREEPCSLEPRAVPGLTGVVELSAGGAFVCARLEDGGLTCWGNNADGELGRGVVGGFGSKGELPGPVPGLADVTQVSAGNNSACARLRDASLWCWGGNEGRQVGTPDNVDQPTPVRLK